MNALGAFFSRNAWRVFHRNLLAWQKYAWSSVAINIVEPFAYFLALGFGLGAYFSLTGYGSLVQFMAPGFLGLTALNTATFDAAWGAYERRVFNGVYESMVTAPVDPLEIAAGEYLWQAFRSTLYGCLFLAVIAGFGLVHSWWALLCPLVLALSGIVFAIPALLVSFVVKTQEHLFYYFSFVVTPMVMIGGVFFPLDKFPKWALVIAWLTPLYHAVKVFRALVLGTVTAQTALEALWILVAIAVFAFVPVRSIRAKLAN
ncbi:MAG: ABC transporter permease [Candidatus Eremiobacteraeota bacterium]|nr:ABC transporter permease [Candidatus Eremiobacteraeota bacterium]MBV8262694.1 ABC transporter permease [Candidatus Eremiobacteraeota bacterium]MBV8461549.1 ABC transporter permease [Candidatus Eremiobacteraeota bacterium]MBV8595628.1 ABC transporter permease [Candidatus Eremiobacteraeota bacterium]MBV8667681.1 ABC transporter permease [Candidatus Eremiobacteraeota bacterium]